MAQTKQAKNQEANQPRLEANEKTQTPPSRQVGANQPLGSNDQSQSLATRNQSQQSDLAQREQFWSPFSFMRRFSEEMDRLFDDFGFSGALMPRGFRRDFEEMSAWSPQTEVFERGSDLVIRADLPGLTKDDINVDIEDDQIIIQGERHDEREENREGFYHSERSYGSFYRSIPLPQGIDAEAASANFNNGVLEITMPKPEQKSRGRRIEIGEGGGQTQISSENKSKTAK